MLKRKLNQNYFFKKVLPTGLKAILATFIIFSLYLFLGQKKVKDASYGENLSQLVENFIYSDNSPIRWFSSWFSVDKGELKLSKDEELTKYKLTLLSRSIDNYFQSLLGETKKLVRIKTSFNLFDHGKTISAIEKYKINDHLKSYLNKNLDIMEISLFDNKGKKLTRIKYKSIKEYDLSEKIMIRLKKSDNILIKNGNDETLVLISAIKNSGEIMGLISQTIHPVFFTKILDFLSINDNLFYIKNADNELIVDNYNSFKFLRERKMSFPYLFYKNLTKDKESTLKINIDQVEYSIGVIVEENNIAGHVFAILLLILIICLGVFITLLFWKNIQLLMSKKENTEIEDTLSKKALSKEADSSNQKNKIIDLNEKVNLNLETPSTKNANGKNVKGMEDHIIAEKLINSN